MSLSQPISEFDHVFEQERARRLRRRFLWYCGVSIALSLPTIYPILNQWNTAPEATAFFVMGMISVSLTILLYGAAIIYAARTPHSVEAILRLALWLYVIAGSVGVINSRIAMEFLPGGQANVQIKLTTRPSTREVEDDRRMREVVRVLQKPAGLHAVSIPLGLLFTQLFICLFMPWSLRESLRPVPAIYATCVVIFVVDLIGGRIGWWGLIPLVLCALAFAPGSLWCWWRFSRFRTNFKLRYESRGFQKLQSELEGARRVHEAQLPAPRQHGRVRMNYVYEPMRQIGGDLLFAHSPDDRDDSLSVVVLDVTGHGIAAALSVNRLIGELERIFAESPGASPGQVLCALNRYVHLTLARHDLYVTAICLRADAQSGRIEWASGGHPTAFLRRADGTVEGLESTATLLGVESPAEFADCQSSKPFEVGDAVIAYTDGAAEARNIASGFALGMSGVQRLLMEVAQGRQPATEWPGHMMRRVLDYRGSPPEDDTLVVSLYRV